MHNSRYQTGKIQYVENAFVSAPFAGSDDTDQAGRFDLVFTGMEAGTVVQVQVDKAGLEVVNGYDLQQVVIGRRPLLQVFLAPKGQLAQAQTDLYNISKEALYAEKDALIERLLGSEKESQAAIQALEERLGVAIGSPAEAIELLENRLAQLSRQLPQFAQQLARQNLDFASARYINAFEHFQAGRVEQAIAALEPEALDEEYRAAAAAVAAAEADIQALEHAMAKRRQEIEQVARSYALKAEAHQLLFQYPAAAAAYAKALEIAKTALPTDTWRITYYQRMLAWAYRGAGQYQEAIAIQQEELNWLERAGDTTSLSYATALLSLAELYLEAGQAEPAQRVLEREQALLQRIDNVDSTRLAKSWASQAGLHMKLGQYDKAIVQLGKALPLLSRHLPADDPDVLAAHSNRAAALLQAGEHQRAQQVQEEVIARSTEALGAHAPQLATAYRVLALILQGQNQFAEALEAHHKALAISRKSLGEWHPSVPLTRYNMASLFMEAGSYDSCAAALALAEEGFRKVLPREHPHWAQLYNLKGMLAQSREGDYTAAVGLFQQAIDMGKAVWPEDHPTLGVFYNNLGAAYRDAGRYKKALEPTQRGLEISRQRLPAGHPQVGNAYNSLANVYLNTGDYNQALQAIREALIIFETGPANYPAERAIAYNTLATVHYHLGNQPAAVEAQQRAMELLKGELPEGHPQLVYCYHNSSVLLRMQAEWDIALQYAQRAAEMAGASFPPHHALQGEISANLETIYASLAEEAEADSAYTEALSYYRQALNYSPDSAIYLSRMALAHYYAEQHNLAVPMMEKAWQLASEAGTGYAEMLPGMEAALATLYEARGLSRLYKQQPDEALEDFQRALPITNDSASVYNHAGIAYFMLEAYSDAIDRQNRACQIWRRWLREGTGEAAALIANLETARSNFAAYHQEQGQALRAGEHYPAAIEAFERSLSYGGDSASVYSYIGLCHSSLGAYELALGAHEASYQLDSTRKVIYFNNTGIAYAKLGDLQLAKARFEALERLIPEAGLPYRDWALYYALAGEPGMAMASLEKAAALGYDNWAWIEQEAALAAIRALPAYKALRLKYRPVSED